jgi:hypothetical protein
VRKDWLRLAILDRGLLTVQQLEEVEHWARVGEVPLFEKLYRSGLVSDAKLLDLLLEQGAKDATAELDQEMPPPAALGALDRETASRTRAIPLGVKPPRLIVGMLDPSDSASLERIAFYCGLLVEPRAVKASVLFRALHEAYGIPVVGPDPNVFGGSASAMYADDEIPDELPPPSANLPEVKMTGVPPPDVRAKTPQADPSTSPLAAQLISAAGGQLPDYAATPSGEAPAMGWLSARGPSSPALEDLPNTSPDTDTVHLRDTLPPQVLPLLEKHFRTVIMFLVRDNVAVGWDGSGEGVSREQIRDVLIPLTAPSAFARAWTFGMVASGSVREPTTIERIFFRFLGREPPRAFVVLPIQVGQQVSALIYVDLEIEVLDEEHMAVAHQVGLTLADALAPLVAENRIFG